MSLPAGEGAGPQGADARPREGRSAIASRNTARSAHLIECNRLSDVDTDVGVALQSLPLRFAVRVARCGSQARTWFGHWPSRALPRRLQALCTSQEQRRNKMSSPAAPDGDVEAPTAVAVDAPAAVRHAGCRTLRAVRGRWLASGQPPSPRLAHSVFLAAGSGSSHRLI